MTSRLIRNSRPLITALALLAAGPLLLCTYALAVSEADQPDRLEEPSDADSLRFAKAGTIVNIIKDKADLRTAFNNDKDKTRFLTILSPT